MVNLTMRVVAAFGLLLAFFLSSATAQEKESVQTLLEGSEWSLTIHVPKAVLLKAAKTDEDRKRVEEFLKGAQTAPMPGTLSFKKQKDELRMVQTHQGKPAERKVMDAKVEKATLTFRAMHLTAVEQALNEPTHWQLAFTAKDGKFLSATGRLKNSTMDAEVTLKRAAPAKPKEKGKK